MAGRRPGPSLSGCSARDGAPRHVTNASLRVPRGRARTPPSGPPGRGVCAFGCGVSSPSRSLKHSVPVIVRALTIDERTLSLLTVALSIAVVVLAVWVALLQRSSAQLRARLRRVLPGGEEVSLDESLSRQLERIEGLDSRLDALNKLHHELEAITQRTIQKVGVVRYNPFHDSGGDQSFALALLDPSGNGVVVSSLHSRTETRVFAKPVQAGRSRYPLSDEEQDAIKKALAPTA